MHSRSTIACSSGASAGESREPREEIATRSCTPMQAPTANATNTIPTTFHGSRATTSGQPDKHQQRRQQTDRHHPDHQPGVGGEEVAPRPHAYKYAGSSLRLAHSRHAQVKLPTAARCTNFRQGFLCGFASV